MNATDLAAHLAVLRSFYQKRIKDNPYQGRGNHNWKLEQPYLAALGDHMVTWAEGTDTEIEPISMEHAVVCAAAQVIRAANADGQLVGCEVLVFPPEQTTHDGAGSWRICWEAGPHQWGVGASMQGEGVVSRRYTRHESFDWHVEPYYSFDICFCFNGEDDEG